MHGSTNSVPTAFLQPRITLITGLDTLGNLYLAILQCNNNTKIMELFYHHLCAKLDKERPKWRDDTIIMHDNASYAVSEAAHRIYRDLQLPMMFTGPHSYTVSPIELVFALLKRTDINPLHHATGKK